MNISRMNERTNCQCRLIQRNVNLGKTVGCYDHNVGSNLTAGTNWNVFDLSGVVARLLNELPMGKKFDSSAFRKIHI